LKSMPAILGGLPSRRAPELPGAMQVGRRGREWRVTPAANPPYRIDADGAGKPIHPADMAGAP